MKKLSFLSLTAFLLGSALAYAGTDKPCADKTSCPADAQKSAAAASCTAPMNSAKDNAQPATCPFAKDNDAAAACPRSNDSAAAACCAAPKTADCCDKAAPAASSKNDAAPTAAAPASAYPLKTCIVSGEELGSMGDNYVYTYKEAGKPDREIVLCCKMCVKKFQKEPAKYLKMIDDAQAAAAAAPAAKK